MALIAGHPSRRRARSDAGSTLIEVVIAIVLLGTVVAAIMTAVQTGVRSSSQSRGLAQIQTVLLNSADRVNRAPKGCGHTSDGSYVPYYRQFVMPAVKLQWPDYTGQVTVAERHFVPPPALPNTYTLQNPGTWADGGCDLNDPQPLEVQLVTITITTPDGQTSRTIEVVKSDV
jgi:type II secretory pathway pseudopilin PulG